MEVQFVPPTSLRTGTPDAFPSMISGWYFNIHWFFLCIDYRRSSIHQAWAEKWIRTPSQEIHFKADFFLRLSRVPFYTRANIWALRFEESEWDSTVLQGADRLGLAPVHRGGSHCCCCSVEPYTALAGECKQLSGNAIRRGQVRLRQDSGSVPAWAT